MLLSRDNFIRFVIVLENRNSLTTFTRIYRNGIRLARPNLICKETLTLNHLNVTLKKKPPIKQKNIATEILLFETIQK